MENRISPNNIDHINVKIFAHEPAPIDLADAIPVFHRWIQDSVLDELLIDVTDYSHVPAGPGVLLIGHDSNYSLDLTFDRLGLLYNRKTPSEGTVRDKLLKAFGAALMACSQLEDEEPFRGKLKFNAGSAELIFNDRLLAPNTPETWTALRPEIEKFFDGLLGSGTYTLAHVGQPRERFRVDIQAKSSVEVRSLLLESSRNLESNGIVAGLLLGNNNA
jgi:hypothetical protein